MKKLNKNPELLNLIKELKTLAIKEDVKLWKRIASDLEKSTRNKRVVNISKIARFTKENDVIIVPGKVLNSGEINHTLTVSALSFSDRARQKINLKGKSLSIQDLMKENPKAKGIKIIG
jgi:large subunit ribosomal protein L18e